MSIDANPSIKEIATTFGDTPPYSMSELYGLNFSSGNAVVSGTISLSGFSNKTVELASEYSGTKILASDGASDDQFGVSVSISSDKSTVIVGAMADDDNGSASGSAYIFEKVNGTWTQRAKLTASDGTYNYYFGYSVSISSDKSTVIVGAYYVSSRTGSAYIFEKVNETWTQQAKLTASDGASNDYFGWSVSISSDGSTVIVGAWADDTSRGSAYIYEKPGGGWTTTSTHAAKLTASDGANYDNFGHSVFISSDGSMTLVGAWGHNGSTGSAYIYEKPGGGWTTTSTHTAKLTASDGAGNDRFGKSVSISSDKSKVLVGAYYDDTRKGSAYIYEKPGGGWTTTSTHAVKLTASDGANYDNFGYYVSISSDGSTALVGAVSDDSTRGSAYIYEPSYFVN